MFLLYVMNLIGTNSYWVSCVGPGARLVVKLSGGGGLWCGGPLFTLFRLYIKWSLALKHVCAGGGGLM